MSTIDTQQDQDHVVLSRDQLELQKAKAFADLVRFGFRGTLAAGISGMVFILLLAVLDAFTEFEIATFGILGLGLFVLAGAIAFGYFSLHELPKVVVTKGRIEITTPRRTS